MMPCPDVHTPYRPDPGVSNPSNLIIIPRPDCRPNDGLLPVDVTAACTAGAPEPDLDFQATI